MRAAGIFKAAFCLGLALIWASAQGALYRDGTLYLDVLLASGSEIALEPAPGEAARITLREQDSPVEMALEGKLRLSLNTAERLSLWGFLNRSEPWADQPDGYLAESYAWVDSALVIKRENLVFEETTFELRELARLYALETGIPEAQIRSLPLSNATLQVSTESGEQYYFETPLLIQSDSPISVGGVKLGFSGEFLLKAGPDRLVFLQRVALEDYVAGVVPNEIGNTVPLEAMKAQAVAARTHAVDLLLYRRHTAEGYDLCSGTHCQVYKGTYLVNPAVLEAVEATRGEIMLSAGRIADATYHSSCGGKTDSSAEIWRGRPLPHLAGVCCLEEACALDLTQEEDLRRWIDTPLSLAGMSSWEKGALSWQKTVQLAKLAEFLGLPGISRIRINRRGPSGRITDISFLGSGTARLTSEYKIRQAFGDAKSSFFYIQGAYTADSDGTVEIAPPNELVIRGRGSGHGVGMCQVGALRRARGGALYRDILAHYYPGTVISGNWMCHER